MKFVEYKPTSGLTGSGGPRLRPAWPLDPCPGASPSSPPWSWGKGFTRPRQQAWPVGSGSVLDLLWLSSLQAVMLGPWSPGGPSTKPLENGGIRESATLWVGLSLHSSLNRVFSLHVQNLRFGTETRAGHHQGTSWARLWNERTRNRTKLPGPANGTAVKSLSVSE